MFIATTKLRQSLCAFALLLCCFAFNQAQKPSRSSATMRAASPSAAAAAVDESLFKAMRWRQVGPFRGGRVLAVTGVPGEPNIFYFGGASSGVWKTIDAGANWTPIFDHESIASIGAIAVAPSDHNIIYVGSGEACIRGNITYGNGVYKTIDGGRTWRNIGLRDTRHIGAVIVDPKNPNVVFVAALGHAYGPNEERGVFRTTAARPGRKCSSRTTRRARLMSFSIPQIQQRSLPRSGRFIARLGVFRAVAPAAGSTNQSMAARRGNVSKVMDCPRESWAASGFPLPAIPIGCMH